MWWGITEISASSAAHLWFQGCSTDRESPSSAGGAPEALLEVWERPQKKRRNGGEKKIYIYKKKKGERRVCCNQSLLQNTEAWRAQNAAQTLRSPPGPGAAAAPAVQHRPLPAPLLPKPSLCTGNSRQKSRGSPRCSSDIAGGAACVPWAQSDAGIRPPAPRLGLGSTGWIPALMTQWDVELERELIIQPWLHPASALSWGVPPSHQVYTDVKIPERIITSTADDTSPASCFDFVTTTGERRCSSLTWKNFHW